MLKQKGAIPIIVLVALAVSAFLGGFIGFQFGDGSLFSFGVGFGIVLILLPILSPYLAKLKTVLHKGEYEE